MLALSGADVFFGIIAVLIGAAFCFQGYLTMRLVIPIWGAFAGFSFGAGLVAAIGNDGFLSTGVGWIVGLVTAVVFALFAYLYYAVAVVLTMGAIGFALGSSAMYALNIHWRWLVVLVGIAAGVLLALLALIADMPMLLLVVLSAMAGAAAIVGGIMFLTGALDTGDVSSDRVIEAADHGWWWTAMYAALAIVGIVVQLRATARWRMSMRDAWDAGSA
ncbi:MAG: DUF4203 domain-containing protein [Ilumatobacteraceae bacterium]